MKKFNLILSCIVFIFLSACDSNEFADGGGIDDGAFLSTASGGSSGAAGSQGNNNPSNQAGLITAAEWNDLDNWGFWKGLLQKEDYTDKSDYWRFYTNNRISILVQNGNTPLINAKVVLKKSGNTIWESKTDNFGKAELWINLFQKQDSINSSDLSLFINDEKINTTLKLFDEGLNQIAVNSNQNLSNSINLAFIVDATGSMGDELSFLKNDLKNVIQRVTNSDIYTAAVFYRDEGDAYLVRKSDFSAQINTTLGFINEQNAGGGGDFPEAVHTALNTAINDLQWTDNARTKIAFLLLDAPPHYTPQILDNLHESVKEAAKKGIKLIPITASGIDKETEFLMRFCAISTNGTYVFITNDSGIGGEHLEASVGDYQVEYLNDLMLRLINKYSE